MRRLFDICASVTGLLMTAPLCATIALAIVLETGTPAFFSQQRVGKDGKRFRILKFRTMHVGQVGPAITVAKDPRITRVGGFLRATKLDELPQLWNVLRGEMAVVGPRPELPAYVSRFAEQYALLLTVRPGIVDNASLALYNEADRLGNYSDPSRAYVEWILPEKVALSTRYLCKRNWLTDLSLISRAFLLIAKSLFR